MKPPLFLSEQGDLQMFESLDDLELSVETPDVAGYRVFDSEGFEYGFEQQQIQPKGNLKKTWFGSVQILPVRVNWSKPLATAPQEFDGILRQNLRELGLEADILHNMSMRDMVEFWRVRYFAR